MAVSPLTYAAQQPTAPIQQYFIEEYCSEMNRANYKSGTRKSSSHSDITNSDRKTNNINPPTKPPLHSKRTEFLPSDITMQVHATDFHAVKPGQFIDSPLHDIWGLQWFLRLYPKGPPPYHPKFSRVSHQHLHLTNFSKSSHSNFHSTLSQIETCALYLCVDNIPSPSTTITVTFRLHCDETNTSLTEIGSFSQETWHHGFHGEAHHLRVPRSKLDSNALIQLGCHLNLIQMVEGTDHELTYSNPIELLDSYHFTWRIPKHQIRQFMQCPVGKRFESPFYPHSGPHAPSSGELWSIHVYPKGTSYKTMDEVLVAVQQCIFPEDVSFVTVRVQIECVELHKIWSAVYELNVDHNTTKPWPAGTLKMVELNALRESMTLRVKVVVIEQHQDIDLNLPKVAGNGKIDKYGINGLYLNSPSLSRSKSSSNSLSSTNSKRSNRFRFGTVTVEGTYLDDWYQNTQRNKVLLTVIRALFGRHCVKTKIKRSSSASLDEMDIMKLIRAYYPWHVHEWSIINGNVLRQFLVARNKQKFESDIFEIGGFKWYFKIYPVE